MGFGRISYLYRIQIWSNLSITTLVTILYLNQLSFSWKKSQKKNPKGDPKLVEYKKKEINEYLETWQSDLKQGKL